MGLPFNESHIFTSTDKPYLKVQNDRLDLESQVTSNGYSRFRRSYAYHSCLHFTFGLKKGKSRKLLIVFTVKLNLFNGQNTFWIGIFLFQVSG